MKKTLLFVAMLVFMFNLSAQDSAPSLTEMQEDINLLKAKVFNNLSFNGDVRIRYEYDFNSMKTNGDMRDNRERFRYRMRFGFKYAQDNFEFGARIRSGNPANQQSPHNTFGNEFHSGQFSIDKAYIKAKKENVWIWAGKNGMPFWGQNELLWDGDVNPEGVAAGGTFKFGENFKVVPVLGYFIPNSSGKALGQDGQLAIGQVKACNKFGDNKLTIATGLVYAKNIGNKPDATATYNMDYSIWASSLQYSLKKVGDKKIGLTFGFDFFKNLQDYTDNTNMNDLYKNQTTGFVGSLKYDVKKFQFGYYYAMIQKYAVVDYFAQDDWMRWGNSDYTRASNFVGHEIRAKYKITNKFNTVLRAYFITGVVTTKTNLETGNRVRLDFNYKF